jgi:hypothetical protein
MEAIPMKVSKKLIAQRNKVSQLWDKMCAADNIPCSSTFVSFSPSNPFAKKYNVEISKLQIMVAIHKSFVNMPLFFQERYSRAYDAAIKEAF